MTDGTMLAVGLSVGTTTLAAVTSNRAVRKAPILTVAGMTIADFVDRVGDPVGIVAPDGSSHRAERVLADALREVAYQATDGRPLPDVVAVAVPAHWSPGAVDALSRALARVPEWTQYPPTVLSDVATSLTALQADPGLPSRGVIAVCDFGGSGTSITLVDASTGYQPVGPTVRHLDFSGDLVDQGLLTHVIGELAGAGSVDLNSTSAIGSLWRLRAQCRGAKERLSAGTVTAMPVELPDFRGDVRITRTELDSVVREPLAGFVDVLHDTLGRNGIHPADLSAVASVGGGAGMAAVTTTLSEHLRVPVVTGPRSALLAATGAALRALRGPADDTATAMANAVPARNAAATGMAAALPGQSAAVPARGSAAESTAVPSAAPTAMGALAWSEAPDGDLQFPDNLADLYEQPATGLTSARPQLEFEVDQQSASAAPALQWYRRPLAVMVASTVVIVGAVSAIGVVLTNDSSAAPASEPIPSISSNPAAPAVAQPPAQAPAEAAQLPAAAPRPRTVIATPAPVTRTQMVQQQAPPVTVEAPPPAPVDPPPPVTSTVTETVSPPPTTQAPPPSEEPPPSEPPPSAEPPPTTQAPTTQAPSTQAPSTQAPAHPQWVPTIPPIPTIPGLPPFVPQPGGAVPQP